MPFEYTVVSMTRDELAEEREVYGGLADSVRALVDASLRSTLPAEEVTEIRVEVDRLATVLGRTLEIAQHR